jgi:hypothetical protein
MRMAHPNVARPSLGVRKRLSNIGNHKPLFNPFRAEDAKNAEKEGNR